MKQETKLQSGNIITEIKNKDGRIIRRRVQSYNYEPSMTEQQFAKDADANYIMSQYINTGRDPFIKKQGYYADISEIPDLSQALDQVTKAQSAFDSLDSKVRTRFGNSPAELLKFLQDPENTQEGIKLGLLAAPVPAPEPMKVQIIPEPVKL